MRATPHRSIAGMRAVAGPYWTPAEEDGVWLNCLVEAPVGGANVRGIAAACTLDLQDGETTESRNPHEVVRSPVWSGIWAVRYRLERGRWESCEPCVNGKSARVVRIPRPARRTAEDSTSPRFLVCSDLQMLPLVPRTVGAARKLHDDEPFDAMLFAGDLVECPERRTDWWGDAGGRSFFDLLSPAAGDGILGASLLLPCPGNHDVSAHRGRTPEERLDNVMPDDWQLRVYEHLFRLPELPAHLQRARRERFGAGVGSGDYYSYRIGDTWVAALFATRRYAKGDHAQRTGPAYEWPGRFIYEPITRGSLQYEWLRRRLAAPACRTARVRIVLLHHGIYSQGHGSAIPFGHPLAYEENLLVRDLAPLLREAGVHVVINGHNHIVNHHIVDGVHYLESSHAGVTYRPYRQSPDGSWAREPFDHPSRLLIHDPGEGYVSVLDTRGPGRLLVYRASPEGKPAPVDETELGFRR
ncbi:MAG: hypothetical protein GF355_03665 [Candidatus Eisenbacteria bacterium]|nr:hypothetical protein [Candidatus Eisenbacteria bacterium]